MVASAWALILLATLVLPSGTSWAAEDGVTWKVAVSADLWELAGSGGTPRWAVESETNRPIPGLLAGRVGTRVVAVAVTRTGADNTVQCS